MQRYRLHTHFLRLKKTILLTFFFVALPGPPYSIFNEMGEIVVGSLHYCPRSCTVVMHPVCSKLFSTRSIKPGWWEEAAAQSRCVLLRGLLIVRVIHLCCTIGNKMQSSGKVAAQYKIGTLKWFWISLKIYNCCLSVFIIIITPNNLSGKDFKQPLLTL